MTTSSNPFTEYYLVQEILGQLGALGYRNDIKVTSADTLKTLKERLVTGPADLTLGAKNRFSAVLQSRDYCEGICKRHYFGVRRIERLSRSAERLADKRWATAWTLTTCYYSSFFSALELLELTGRHMLYLSNDEAEQITVFAKAGANRLSPGSYLGVAQQGGNPSEIEVHFAPSGKKPHEFAWEQFAKLVGGVAAGSPEAVKHQVSMMRFLGRKGAMPWQKPNEVRNLWNYSDARLFCEHGETEGNKMAEFILAPKEAVKWGIGKQIHACDRDHATGLSYIRASLSGAIERVAQTILPERLAGQIAA
jgi:hypothetical protein